MSEDDTVGASLLRIARSGRVYWGVGVNAASSIGNFAVSIAIARQTVISEFGQFAIAFALYALATGLVRAAIAEPLLATTPTARDFRDGTGRASLVALGAGILLATAAAVLASPYLWIAAATIHGLCVYDYSKTMNLAFFRRSVAGVQECAWLTAAAVGAVLAVTGAISGLAAFTVWSVSGATIGYGAALSQRLRPAPGWRRSRVPTRASLAFAGDYLVGSGSAQLGFNAVGTVAGLSTVGGLRAAGTLLGPVGIILGSARTLAIPYLTRRHTSPRSVRRAALTGTLVIAVLGTPALALVAVMPAELGTLALGENWPHAAPLLPFLALEMLFAALTTMPFAGFRALMAGRTSLLIRSCLAVVRIGAVAIAAFLGGALAAAVAMASVAAVGMLVWWVGYLILLNASEEAA